MEAIDQRTKAALDEITEILKDVSQDKSGRLTIQGLLDDTGSICERKDFQSAKIFAIGKSCGVMSRGNNRTLKTE